MSTNLSGTTLTLGNTSLTENTLKALNNDFYVSGGTGPSSSTNLSGTTLTLGNTSLTEDTLKAINNLYYVSGSAGPASSTNLSGTTLTLGNTSLTENTLKAIINNINCKAGDTIILDGIECLCVATGVTIQGSNLTRIAVDKNYDLGHYQQYVGVTQNGIVTKEIKMWRWGGYGTKLGNTSQEVGYGLKNTINCLANKVNYTKGTYTGTTGDGYPWLWIGVNDFRSSHSDKWFVPSSNELKNYVRPYKSSLSFDATTRGNQFSAYWSSSEGTDTKSYRMLFNGNSSNFDKYNPTAVRLCRAF